jgi:hypothetical protein
LFPGPINVESGMLSITSQWTPNLITVGPNGALGGNNFAVPIVFNGGVISPGDDGSFQTIGTLHFGQSVDFSNTTNWNMDLDVPGVVGGPNDLVEIDGPVTLDGIINVNGLENFGVGVYTLALLNGPVIDNGMALGLVPPDYLYNIVLTQSLAGNTQQLLLIVSDVPEPASLGVIAIAGLCIGRRARRRD